MNDQSLLFQINARNQLGDGDGNDLETCGLFTGSNGTANFGLEQQLVVYGNPWQKSVKDMSVVRLRKMQTFSSQAEFDQWWRKQHQEDSTFHQGVWYLVKTIVGSKKLPEDLNVAVEKRGGSWHKMFSTVKIPGFLDYTVPLAPSNGRSFVC